MPSQSIREMAVDFTVGVLRTATDWQDGQHALANHPTIGPWLNDTYGSHAVTEVQAIIREAERRLGDDLPYEIVRFTKDKIMEWVSQSRTLVQLRNEFVEYCRERQRMATKRSQSASLGVNAKKAEVEVANGFRTAADFWQDVTFDSTDESQLDKNSGLFRRTGAP